MKKLTRSELLLVGILGCALLGQFARFETPVGKVSAYEPLLAVFSLFHLPWRGKREEFGGSPLFFLALLFVWVGSLTVFRGWQYENLGYVLQAGSYLARLALYVLFALSLWQAKQMGKVKPFFLDRAVSLWLCFQAIVGIAQYLFLPDTRILFWLGWDDHLSRAFGTLLDPGFFGVLMALGALLALPRLLGSKERWWAFAQFCLCFLAMIISYSRSSYAAFLVGVVLLAFFHRQRKWLLFIPLLIAGLVFVPKDGGGEGQNLARTSTLAIREEVVTVHTKKTPWDVWVFGRGWNYEQAIQLHRGEVGEPQYTLPGHSAGVDVTPLHVILSSGALGAAFLGAFYFQAWRRDWWTGEQWVWLGALWVHGLFSLSPLYAWILLIQSFVLLPKQKT